MIESTVWGNTRLALVSPNELKPIEFSLASQQSQGAIL